MTKFIHIDYRNPRSKTESVFYGQSNVDSKAADVFINVKKNRNGNDLADTFFHEMAHVFFAFHGKTGQMTSAKEERLAQQLGRVCAGILR